MRYAAGRCGWWLWGTLIGLLLAGCCFWTGVGTWLFAPLTPFLANRLSQVQKQAELLVPAQAGAITGHLSPDGRRMLLRAKGQVLH